MPNGPDNQHQNHKKHKNGLQKIIHQRPHQLFGFLRANGQITNHQGCRKCHIKNSRQKPKFNHSHSGEGIVGLNRVIAG